MDQVCRRRVRRPSPRGPSASPPVDPVGEGHGGLCPRTAGFLPPPEPLPRVLADSHPRRRRGPRSARRPADRGSALPLVGLRHAPPPPGRRDRRGARRPRLARRDADGRRQEPLLPGAAAGRRDDRRRGLATGRPDEGSGRCPGGDRLSGGRAARRDVAGGAGGGPRPARRGRTAAPVHGAGAAGEHRPARPAGPGRREAVRDRRGPLHQPVGSRLPPGIPATGPAPRPVSGRQHPRLHGHRHAAGSRRHRPPARPPLAGDADRHLRSPEPRVSGRAPRRPGGPGAEDPRPPSGRGFDRVLHLAERDRAARCPARRRGPARPALPCRPRRPRAARDPGGLRQRDDRRRRGDGGLRHGHRPFRRPPRAPHLAAQEPGGLPTGDRAGGPRRPGGRVRAALFVGRRLQLGIAGPQERRGVGARRRRAGKALRRAGRAPARHAALRPGRPLPPRRPVGVFRPGLPGRLLRRLRRLPR